MGQEFINLFIAVSGVIVSIIAFIWRLSNKYTNIESNIVLMKAELDDVKKNINNINLRVNAHENRMDILTTNINIQGLEKYTDIQSTTINILADIVW